MRVNALVAAAVLALACIACQPTGAAAKKLTLVDEKAVTKPIPPEEPLDIALERLDTEGQPKAHTEEQKRDKGAAVAAKGAIGPSKGPSFVEAGTQAKTKYRGPDGWGAGPRNLHALRAHAVDHRMDEDMPGVCGADCPAVADAAGADVCYQLGGWCYYYATEALHRRVVLAIGRPTRGGGEETTDFESDLVRTVGWGHVWDHAGHIRANSLGGSRHPFNVFPQGAVSNTMGSWRKAERAVERTIASSDACRDNVLINIRFTYANDDATRPNGGRYYIVVEADGCHLPRATYTDPWMNSECGHVNE